MKNIALAATLALALCAPAQARLIEVVTDSSAVAPAAGPAPTPGVVVLQPSASNLPEPQVLAMMLLGLCLIGYKARQESSEKFK